MTRNEKITKLEASINNLCGINYQRGFHEGQLGLMLAELLPRDPEVPAAPVTSSAQDDQADRFPKAGLNG